MSAGASYLSLVWVVLFIGAIALLPWLVRRWQHGRGQLLPGAAAANARVLSSVAVGPQQRVVTVEAGTPGQRVVLVLGVTAQQINCLHVLKAASFSDEVAAARGAASHA